MDNYRKQNDGKVDAPTSQSASGYVLFGLFIWGVGVIFRLAGVPGGNFASIFLLTDLVGLILIVMGIRIAILARKKK